MEVGKSLPSYDSIHATHKTSDKDRMGILILLLERL